MALFGFRQYLVFLFLNVMFHQFAQYAELSPEPLVTGLQSFEFTD